MASITWEDATRRAAMTIMALGLLMVGCVGGTEDETTITTVTPATISTTSTQTPATPTTIGDPVAVQTAGSVIETEMAGFRNEDPAITSVYADDVQYYDVAMGDEPVNKNEIDEMAADPEWWDSFDVDQDSYFVSGDGRFAATVGVFSAPEGSPDAPAVSLREVEDDKIVWAYDYYGGGFSETTQMLTFGQSMLEAGSPEAQTAVAEATAAVEQWRIAHNSRDAEAFLLAYAEEVTYVDVVSPDWRVLTKAELAQDATSHFADPDFQSALGPSPIATDPGTVGSPIDPFVISSDGRFAAVQGSYKDDGMISAKPMVTILELRAGQIIRQYNFMLIPRYQLDA